MAKKKKTVNKHGSLPENAHIAGAGLIEDQRITETLETNFMPYAMSVILSRAIPEIDGFKPSHRKLLYTMYRQGLLTGPRTKSANIVGETMKLNPHGDAAIYETMVRLSKGYEALLHPYVDSKGNFGRAYSTDMEYAASRYTEARLEKIAAELFYDIDKDTVDFANSYDNQMKEPTLLPVTFPSILVNNNIGIAVGMASAICSFNLKEVCETTVALMKDSEHDISSTLLAPDFPGGGYIVYDRDAIRRIYETGRGPVKVRSKYSYDKSANCIDVTEIPSTTSAEAIIAKLIELVKNGRVREISDVRNEIGLDGLKITIDLKRGIDAEKFMAKMFAVTPLEDSFSCNFNILVNGSPRVMGVREILTEWISFRVQCVRRRVSFELGKAKEKLHLLRGLSKILLDIDKAISIVRETDEEREVVPNLMIGFGIDEIQAEYVAEIRLRHLNREYILRRTREIEKLEQDIAEMEAVLASPRRVNSIIIAELNDVAKKHGQDRKSPLLHADEIEVDFEPSQQEIPDYPCVLFLTREGYFKKITPQSLRMSTVAAGGEVVHQLKEGDRIAQTIESSNGKELLFFTSMHNVYKARVSDFSDTRASALGDYVAARLEFEKGEAVVYMAVTDKYEGYMLFFFENGKAAKVEMQSYYTKTNRKKLIGAYSDKSPLSAVFYTDTDREYLLQSTSKRMLLAHTGAITPKTSRSTIGVQTMTLKGKHRLTSVTPYNEAEQPELLANANRYRTKTIPAAGATPAAEDVGEQLTLL